MISSARTVRQLNLCKCEQCIEARHLKQAVESLAAKVVKGLLDDDDGQGVECGVI